MKTYSPLALSKNSEAARVQGQDHVCPGAVARLFHGRHDQVQGGLMGGQIRGEAAFVAHARGQLPGGQDLFQGLEHLRRHPQGLLKGGAAHRHDHKLLNIQVVAGMGPAVDDVQHGHGERGGPGAPQITVQGQPGDRGPGPGHRHGDRQDGVGPQLALGGGAVQSAHGLIDQALLQGIDAFQGRLDDLLDVA